MQVAFDVNNSIKNKIRSTIHVDNTAKFKLFQKKLIINSETFKRV